MDCTRSIKEAGKETAPKRGPLKNPIKSSSESNLIWQCWCFSHWLTDKKRDTSVTSQLMSEMQQLFNWITTLQHYFTATSCDLVVHWQSLEWDAQMYICHSVTKWVNILSHVHIKRAKSRWENSWKLEWEVPCSQAEQWIFWKGCYSTTELRWCCHHPSAPVILIKLVHNKFLFIQLLLDILLLFNQPFWCFLVLLPILDDSIS